MLIAIMGDTFDMVMEQRAESALKERIGLLADFKVLVDWFGIDLRTPAILVMKPAETDIIEDDSNWDGKMVAIKRTMKNSQQEVRDIMST